METSNVPPPRSKTRMFFSAFSSRPQAMAAAVGSFKTRTTLRPAIMPASLVACLWELSKQAGTVTIAFLIFFPVQDSAIYFILTRTMAEIYSGAYFLVYPLTFGTLMQGLPSLSMMSQGKYFLSYCTVLSVYLLPMSLLTSQMVLVGLTVAWFLAASPMSRSSSVKDTTEGVIRLPSSLGMTSTWPFLKMPTQEQVVPKSIPMMGHSYFQSSATARTSRTDRIINFTLVVMDIRVNIYQTCELFPIYTHYILFQKFQNWTQIFQIYSLQIHAIIQFIPGITPLAGQFILKSVNSKRMLGKENDIFCVNKGLLGQKHVRLGSEDGPFGQGQRISPIKRNKIGDSIITNIFDDYAKSNTEIAYPCEGYGSRTWKQIEKEHGYVVDCDPEMESQWKQKYQQLYKSYEQMSNKMARRDKEMVQMQNIMNNQCNRIQELEAVNAGLSNRCSGFQAQRTSRWRGSSQVEEPNLGRFYTEQLERLVESLQRENKRLSDIVMRKVQHSFDY